MQKNKYLDELGISIENYGTNFLDSKEDKRAKKWKKERKKYGFDERECWNLDHTFIEWLYSHLKKYVNDAKIIDLTYHKFMFKGDEYNQEEAINYILEKLEKALLSSYNGYDEEELKDAINMWAEICSACWW